MARRDTGSYVGYQGRRPSSGGWKRLLTVLVVLLLLAAVALLVGQRYLVYTDEGVKLDLPFFGDGQTELKPEEPDVEIVERSRPAPLPGEDARRAYLRAVPAAVPEVLAGGGVQALIDRGATAAMLRMKGPDGRLAFPSDQPLALGLADGDGAELAAALEALHSRGLDAVAVVSCFRDDALGRRSKYALLTGGRIWDSDGAGLYWADPARSEVRAYLAGLAGELAGLGFDEILLEDCGYPAWDEPDRIPPWEGYDRAHIPAFLAETEKALEGTGCVLSVLAGPAALTGEDTLSGLTAEALWALSGRVWLTADAPVEPPAGAAVPVCPASAFAGEERDLYLIPEE